MYRHVTRQIQQKYKKYSHARSGPPMRKTETKSNHLPLTKANDFF